MVCGCPVCEARAVGRTVTVREYRAWLRAQGPRAAAALRLLADAPDDGPIDPPRAHEEVYITTDYGYARWYAARSQGDLYEVRPVGAYAPSPEDGFPAWRAAAAAVVRVLERGVRLTRRDRREMLRRLKRVDVRRGHADIRRDPGSEE